MALSKAQADASFADTYAELRDSTVALCATLTAEDCNLQAMPETSPPKWHLAHTTWFFETFVLAEYCPGYLPTNPLYAVLFNSYYNGIGEQFPRPQRGLLSRPTLAEVHDYRRAVDAAVIELLDDTAHPQATALRERVELGLHHEAQHQELLLTDIKYSLFQNPLLPAFRDAGTTTVAAVDTAPLQFVDCAGGTCAMGYSGDGFSFDNECPRHDTVLAPYRLASRLVNNGEFLEFVEDNAYSNPLLWLADGWAELQQQGWRHPLYWGRVDGQWLEYTLNGLQPLDLAAPVSHLSYFEAQAFASWAGKRLPTEAEWEQVAHAQPVAGNFLDSDALQPRAAAADGITQLFGDCWEWTQSAYLAYPGFRASAGAVGEYNGKFMSGQMVLRGGSCLSRAFHVRSSYRNFFYPRDRWQCAGIRLAADA